MNDFMQVSQLNNCMMHNQPMILFDPNPGKGACCIICLQEKTGLINYEYFYQKLETAINKGEKQSQQNIQLLQRCLDSIINYKQSLNQGLDKIIQIIVEQIRIQRTFKEKLERISQSSGNQQRTFDNLQKLCENQQQDSKQVRNQIKQQLLDFQNKHFNNMKELIQWNEIQNISIQDVLKNEQHFQYYLIKESCKKEQNICLTFAFNKNSSVLAYAQESTIILSQFNKGKIADELQRLTNHIANVNCLCFMNKSNSLVSGSANNLILIWEQYQGKNYYVKQILKDHTDSINCILLNEDDSLLISGSDDSTIKFWSKINDNWSCIQAIDTNYYVWAISLNQLEDYLISCGYSNVISVLKKERDNQWSIKQTINVDPFGSILCFTDGDQFVFSPSKSDKLQVHNYNEEMKKFEILNNITIQYQNNAYLHFPCQYIQEIKVLSVRHGSHLNIFKANEDGNYQLIQSIDFKATKLFGRLTDDGQNLITWDSESKEIQVRQISYQQLQYSH